MVHPLVTFEAGERTEKSSRSLLWNSRGQAVKLHIRDPRRCSSGRMYLCVMSTLGARVLLGRDEKAHVPPKQTPKKCC